MKLLKSKQLLTHPGVYLILSLAVCAGCSKKPKSVQELVPDLVIDEQSRAKQYRVTASGSHPLIDDLEDGDLNGLKLDGRNWNWSQFDDTTDGIQYLTIVQLDDAPGNGENVLYIKGGDWQQTGAGVSASLVHKVSPRSYGVYDATAYSGIEFWVKAVGLSQLKVTIATPETTFVDDGGVCAENCPGSFQHSVSVSETWVHVTIPFDQFLLTQGKHSLALDPTQIKGIRFAFETLGDYEIWLDEFAFKKEQPPLK